MSEDAHDSGLYPQKRRKRGRWFPQQLQLRRSMREFLGEPINGVHSHRHERVLDPSDRYDKQLLDP